MKVNLKMILGSMFCFSLTLQAMVIRNYVCEKEEVIRTESGIFNEDYLFLGHELNFSGEAEDLMFLGKRLTFEGTTKLGLIALTEKLIYSGTSGNGIIAGAVNVLINGTITGNSFIGGKSLALGNSAVVNGNLFAGGAKLSIDGRLNGDLYVVAGEITINSEIHGNVSAYGGRIVIGDKGKIIGNLRYGTKEKLSDETLAKITGSITIDENSPCGKKDWDAIDKSKMKSIGFIIGMGLFISYIIISVLLLFIPAFRKLDEQQSQRSFWNTALWGLIPVFMYPAIFVMGIVLIITIPFSFMLILAFVPLFFIANVLGTTLIGKYLVTKLKWNIEKRHFQFLIGAFVCALLSMIPFINFLLFLFVSSLGWGVYISFLFQKDLTIAK